MNTKSRWVEVTDADEICALRKRRFELDTPWVEMDGERCWAVADELRAWRKKREREAQS